MTCYRHFTIEELVRHIGAQAGDDLELEGELIRRVREGTAIFEAVNDDMVDEIEDLKIQVQELQGRIARAGTALRAVDKELDKMELELLPEEDEEEPG